MKKDILNGLFNRCSWVVLGALLLFSQIALADIIPSSRLAQWQNAGVPGGIPTIQTLFVNVSTGQYKCVANNGSDISAKLQAAIAACPPNEYIQMNAGTYTVSTGISVGSTSTNWVLRGAGPGQTIIVLKNNASFISGGNIYPKGGGNSISPLLGTAASGTNSISISIPSASVTPSVGNLLLIDQTNGYYNSGPVEESSNQVAYTIAASYGGSFFIPFVYPCSGSFTTNGGVAYYNLGTFPTGCANPSCSVPGGCVTTNIGGVNYYYVFEGNEPSPVIPTNPIVNIAAGGYPNGDESANIYSTGLPPAQYMARGNRSVFHLARITGVSTVGGIANITFTPPLFYPFSQGMGAQAYALGGPNVSHVGIESMTINGAASSGIGISITGGDSCWVTNVEFGPLPNIGINLQYCTGCEIDHCFFHDATIVDSSGEWDLGSCGLLIQNNLFTNLYNTTWSENGASMGNVRAYNCVATINTALGAFWAIDANHGGGIATMGLMEGNVLCAPYTSDGVAAFQTLLRNYIPSNTGNPTVPDCCIRINEASYNNNVVGNVLGCQTNSWSWMYEDVTSGDSTPSIYLLGYPYNGNRYCGLTFNSLSTNAWYAQRNTNVDATILRYDNYDYANNGVPDPLPSGTTLTNSYYTPNGAAPYWWGNNLPWPPFNPNNPSAASVTNIPAGYRYVFGVDPPGIQNPRSSPPSGTNSNLKIFQVR